MYNAKNILSFCAKMRRYIDGDALKVTGVGSFSFLNGESLTLYARTPVVFASSCELMRNALLRAGINPYDAVIVFRGDEKSWRITFIVCKAGTGSKLKSFFKL